MQLAILLLIIALVYLLIRYQKQSRSFLKRWNELLTIPAAFVLWGFSGPILRLFDESAGTYDAGVFQVILFTIIQMLIISGFIRILMKLQWPAVDQYLDKNFNRDFNYSSSCDKLKLSLAVFFALFFASVLLSRVI